MKRLLSFFYLLVFIASNLFSQQTDFPKLTGPYLGQKPPGMTPEIFASGIVSLKSFDEWGLAVNVDCTEIFFSRAENDKASVYYTKYQ